jgi:hypothetical protein
MKGRNIINCSKTYVMVYKGFINLTESPNYTEELKNQYKIYLY